ncbi:hypothetical protein L1049_020286 [Liquidambar formosana]|uniref:Uncharacterized protein n=1 Tax=Liquidambar formosana TaxID=63359 RepID=A0AAP0S790_LIQFO
MELERLLLILWKKMDAEASFLQFRDRVRQRIPLSYESPASNDRTPASNWTERIKVTIGILRERSTDVCIFKVPNELRKVNGDAYSPQIVAIGPLHEGEHDLLTMEEHKWRYMLFFLQRTTNEHNTLDDCSKAILDVVERARESYAQDIKFNKYELAEIMLVDGCFILELFLRCSDPHTEPEDSIIHNDRMVSNLQHDLALLENQIPFCILEKLFYIVYPNRPCPASITELALSFFLPAFKLNKEEIKNKCSFLCDSHSHLLDLLHKFYLPPYPKKDQQGKKSFHAPQQDELRLPLTSDPICEDDTTALAEAFPVQTKWVGG